MKAARQSRATLPMVRCAIYTRKSTEEGLEQEFNSLDAQRESAEAFVASQQHEGWRCLPDRYDDGGFTGGNMDRPALRRLMEDIDAGKVDCVIVYKVDRLSRSLLDFSRMMESFDRHGVSFVSVTQQFNTATSMGRLILNVLLSFAQFEREIIGERTRDKIAATRRKGKWAGGRPVLGYDLDRERSRLVVNEEEAVLVRAIFELYLQYQALMPVVRELQRRGWRNKKHTNKAGKEGGGEPFDKTNLHRLLTNVLYIGKVRYKTEVHQGEQPALIDEKIWQQVQAILARNGNGGGEVRNKFGALLKGLLVCTHCQCAMTPTHTSKRQKVYRYYICTAAQKNGWETCPTRSVPAGEIERLVVSQIQAIGRDPTLAGEVLTQARRQDEQRLAELEAERRTAQKGLAAEQAEEQLLTTKITGGGDIQNLIPRLATLQDRIAQSQRRITRCQEQVQVARQTLLDEQAAKEALAQFDPVWEALSPREQAQLVSLVVQQVGYDGEQGSVSITFHDTGIRALAEQISRQESLEATA